MADAVSRYTIIPSPVGELVLAGAAGMIEWLHFRRRTTVFVPRPDWVEDRSAFEDASKQLAEYFAGRRKEFLLPLKPAGTSFQLRVWDELRRIPYGRTISYGELARRIGQPTAARAVGLANGSKPIAILIPCHRVIGAGGALTGFGGGIDVKRRLLALERGESVLDLFDSPTSTC